MPAMGQAEAGDGEFRACFGHFVNSYLQIKNNKRVEAGSPCGALA